MVLNWKLRPKADKLNPYVKYKNEPNLFSLKVNHGGGFSYVYGLKRTKAPRCIYKGGNADWFDDVDANGFSVIEVSGMLKELGYENPNIKILYKKTTIDLDKGLKPLSKDIDVLELLSYVHKFKLIELFIEHLVDKCVLDKSVIDLDHEDNSVIDGLESSNAGLGTHESEALENHNAGLGTNEGTQESKGIDNDNVEKLDPLFSYLNTNHQKGQSSEHISSPHRNVEGSDDNEESDDTEESEDNEDSDFECDIKDRTDDVHVDMEMIKKNTNPSVEWEFDGDIDHDDDEAERKKALRKISKCHKPVDGHLYTENFNVSQTFPNKVMIKDMVTKILVERRRELPSGESVSNIKGPTDGLSGSQSQPSGIDSNKKKAKKGDSKERNPDTIVKIDVERNYEPDSPTRKFKRIYVCLGALKFGLKSGQRDLLGLDRWKLIQNLLLNQKYLKSKAIDDIISIRSFVEAHVLNHYILTAVGVDSNNDDLELFRNSNFKFVTDRQKEIIPALAETFLAAEHRCATATTVSHFNRVMEELKQANKDIYDWLKDITPQHWAKFHFSARPYCDVLLNNMCEVLNRRLLDGRDKPIITCLEFIREYLMKRIVIVQQVISKSTGPLTPKAAKIFEFIKKQAAQYIISWNGGILYQATGQYGDQCLQREVKAESQNIICSLRVMIVSGDVGKRFADNYPNFQKDGNNVSFFGVVLRVEESMSVYDTDIEDVIEKEEGLVRK
ncbi:hypothetical protein Tco_0560736 [Tanacetum coccineum]